MSISSQRNVGENIVALVGLNPNIILRASTTTGALATNDVPKQADSVAQTGPVIDRQDFTKGFHYSCKVILTAGFNSQKVSTETATVAIRLQDSTSSGGTFANHGSTDKSLTIGDTSTGTVFNDELQFNVDLTGANRFVRLNVTPAISTSTTSTGTASHLMTSAIIAFGGADERPSSST